MSIFRITNLDNLKFPARNKINRDDYKSLHFKDFNIKGRVDIVVSSRGCPFSCTYCAPMEGKKFRMRSPENVVDEIEYLYKTYDATQFTFCDDAFTVDKSRIEELCAEIGSSFLQRIAGIQGKVIDNSVKYLHSWLRVLENDRFFIIKASSMAQHATKFILGNKEEGK